MRPKLSDFEKLAGGFRTGRGESRTGMKASMKGMGLLPRIGQSVGRHPVGSAVGAAWLGLEFLPDIVEGIPDLLGSIGIGSSLERKQAGRFGVMAEAQQSRLRMARRQAEYQRLIEQNTMLMAERMPQSFTQLMAGRRLPQGAAVFGGNPRLDLLEEVAAQMTLGASAQSPYGMDALAGGF